VNRIYFLLIAAFVALAPPLALAQTPLAPAVTQNTVATTGPVTSDTTISVGTLAGQFLEWATTAFGGVLATVGTALLIRLFKKAGLEGADIMSQQLNATLLNGLNDAASRITAGVAGKGTIDVQNQIVQQAIAFAQGHRAETIQALGLDPTSGKAVQALRARIATLVADPNSPTPPALGGPPAASKVS
jgi:hypothetical protein